MVRRLFLAGAGAILLSVSGLGAGRPDFSGVWKLNGDKSDFGPMPKPDKYEAKIDHKDPEMKVTTTQAGEQGERTTDAVFSTDGKETTNKMGPTEMKSKAKWDGSVLVIDSKLDFQGNEISINEKWNLSEDGKTVTIDRMINAPQGDLALKFIMEKQ